MLYIDSAPLSITDKTFQPEKTVIQKVSCEIKSQKLIIDYRKHHDNNVTAKLLVFDYDSAVSANPSQITVTSSPNFLALGKKVKYPSASQTRVSSSSIGIPGFRAQVLLHMKERNIQDISTYRTMSLLAAQASWLY